MNKKTVLLVAPAILAMSVLAPAMPVDVSDIRIDVPDTWEATADPSGFPIEITHNSGGAHLLIFRTDLDLSHTINTADELKLSVQKVVDSVVLSLPNSKLITNTGYNETARTGFALEFVSADPDDGTILRHRLMGWLYKHEDGHQILFTLWGKGELKSYSSHEGEVRQMQAAFEYTGPHKEIVLSSNARSWALPALVIVMAVAGLLYYRSARSSRVRIRSYEGTGWRCRCGTDNLASMHQCGKCGQSRVVARVR